MENDDSLPGSQLYRFSARSGIGNTCDTVYVSQRHVCSLFLLKTGEHWGETVTSFLRSLPVGAVCVSSLYTKHNGSHFGLPPSSIHRMTGLGGNFPYTMTYAHRPH